MLGSDHRLITENWRASLEADIRRPDGALALIGLFWLQPGINTIGSSRDCTLCLPKPAPRLIGAFDYAAPTLTFRGDLGQVFEADGVRADPSSSIELHTDPSPTRITLGDLAIVPNRFGSRLGLQVWDRSRPAAAQNPVRTWFPIEDRFILRAAYTPYPAPVKLNMPDNLGGFQHGYAQGYITFKLEGKSHSLDATELDDGRLFLQFRDLTNGILTHSDGRLLHTEGVAEDGSVVVDFNRAHNPVAAFTAFMPSAAPPKNHVLNCAIEGGERTPAIPPEWR